MPGNILYPIGIDPYSGLWEQLMFEGVLTKGKQGWYKYKDPTTSEEVTFQKPKFRQHAEALMKAADKHDQYAGLRDMMNNPETIEEADNAPEEDPNGNPESAS